MRKLVGVYLALGGKLNAKQSAALATDLKTLDSDLAALSASLTATPTAAKAVAPGAAPHVAVPAGLGVISARGAVDLSSPSSDSYWYMRQLLELARDASLVGQLKGTWPIEATDTAARFRAIAEFVGEYLTLGPAYERLYPALDNDDVRLAAANAPHDLNPVYAAGLAAAATEATANPNGFVDLGTDTTIRVITVANTPGTAWGQVPVSGRFGTADVLGQ